MYGVDISNWQQVGAGDNGADFVICKATEGTGYVDPKCDAHYQRAKSQGKCLGVYHFAQPSYSNARTQAEFFVNNCKGYIKEAILVLDWEVDTWNVAWAKEWLDAVKELTGVKPLIYMSASVISQFDWSSVAGADYGLWVAGYPNKYNVPNPPQPSTGDMPYNIGAWGVWAIWQYTSSAGTLDRNIANMDKNAWAKYAGASGSSKPAQNPQPTPKPQPKEEYYTVQSGDSLWAISQKYGISLNQIISLNPQIPNPDLIYAGQKVRVK